jgi:hypothetical protein
MIVDFHHMVYEMDELIEVWLSTHDVRLNSESTLVISGQGELVNGWLLFQKK